MRVLVIGRGGREHALVWKLAQSPRVERVFCAPGNAGTAEDGANVPIDENDFDALIRRDTSVDDDEHEFPYLVHPEQLHRAPCVVVLNFTPQVRYDYRIKVPRGGRWREILNSDAAIYGGGNVGNAGSIETIDRGSGPELSLVLPPLGGLFLVPEG